MKRARGAAPIRLAVSFAIALAVSAPLAMRSRAQSPQDQGVPGASQIIQYLNQTLEWHRQISTEEQLATEPPDTLFVSDNKQLDVEIVRLSFDFARAAAALQPGATLDTGSDVQPSRYRALQKSAAAAQAEVKQTQQEIAPLREQIASATGRKQRDLQIQMDELQSELALAQTRSNTLRDMMQFVSGAGAAGGNLTAEVDELQHSVPEIATSNSSNAESTKAAATAGVAAGAAAAQNNRRNEPSGILNLVTSLFTLNRKIRLLNEAIGSTSALSQASRQMRSPMVSSLTAAAQQGEQLAKQADTATPAQLQDLTRQLDALTTKFKQLSSVVLPLGKQSILLDSSRSNLTRWRDTVRSQYELELKETALRVVVFGGIIFIVLLLAEVWRRAIFRYIHDIRRRYQFLLLRRILLWCVIGITIAFALASEIGSLATFAGLITAGLAVALQNVILAIAGYFFLIGKYGVRVGDRVQISGITGDVIDIGLIRLHLMEVGGSGSDRHPTGRVVVFSNSVVFQPTASFYKQIPGTNFVWHEVSLMLAPESDYSVAEKRVLGAVEKVFEEYHEHIEQQHRNMEHTLNMTVPKPRPQSRLHLAQNGLEVVVRYPVELDTASEVDDKVTRELLHALAQAPKLRLVGSGTPNIQPVSGPDAAPPEAA
jgi:small-conductance mechanosensitive channel